MSYFPSAPNTVESVLAILAADLIAAVEAGNPGLQVWTPGYGQTQTKLADLLADDIAGDDFLLHGLLAMWARALKSSDAVCRLEAMALLSRWQQQHVAFHLDDAFEQCGVREEPDVCPRAL